MRRLSLLVALAVIVGCSSDLVAPALSPTDTNVVGAYSLTTSNGRLLPIVARLTQVDEWDLVSDQFVISADSTWLETTNYLVTSFTTGAATTQSSTSSGTYVIADSVLKFTMLVGGSTSFTGSVKGNTLALLYNGGTFIYSR